MFDVAAALTGLVLLAPLFVAVAAWIRLDSPGPVFFRQERVGRGGVPFRIHKFRTMRVAAGSVRAGDHRRGRLRGSRARAHSCAAPSSTSCHSSSTCCAAT
jgi:lipopolysaccharide/colanic/teichoic acid biosynthesis glycosyltransferase